MGDLSQTANKKTAKPKKKAVKKPAKKISQKRLTPRQWKNAYAKWAADSRIGTEWLAKELGVGNMTVARQKRDFGWVKNDGVVAVDGHAKLHEKKNELVAKFGRPFIERKDLPEKLKKYFAQSVAYREEKDHLGNIKLVPNMPPNLARFSAENGFHPRSLSNWAYETDENGELVSPELFQSYQIALAYQEAILLEGGLVSAFASPIVQLALKNHHHYRSLTEPPNEGTRTKDDEAELDAIYEAALQKASEMQRAIEGRYYRITGEGMPPENEIVNGDYREVEDD